MKCLDTSYHMLLSLVPGVERGCMAHLSPSLFCPCLACKGIIKVHSKNGTFVAVAEEGRVLYARCADWTCKCGVEDLGSGWMEVVIKNDCNNSGDSSSSSSQRPWVKLTEEKVLEFESKCKQLADERKDKPKQKKARTS